VTDRELQPRFHLLNQLVLSFLAKYCLDLLSRFATDVTKLAMEQEIGPHLSAGCVTIVSTSEISTGHRNL